MVDVSKAQGRLSSRTKLDEMSWTEIKAALDNGQRAVVAAAGSMEQHGPHLPLQVDTLIGTFLVEAIVARVPRLLQGPTIPFGVSSHHMAFAGTITMDKEVFKGVVRNYVESLAHHGFEHIFVIATHGGNFAPLGELVREMKGHAGAAHFHAYDDQMGFVDLMARAAEAEGITSAVGGGHGGEVETSLILAARDELVSMEYAEEGFTGPMNAVNIATLMREGMTALTDNGILGDARPATVPHGYAYRELMAEALADWIRERYPA